MSGRCQACNNVFEKGEGRWIPDLQEHEPLCNACRQAVFDAETDALQDILDLYPDDAIDSDFEI